MPSAGITSIASSPDEAKRSITLFFSDDKLARITGDTVGKETSITHGVVDIEPIEKTGMKIEPGMTLPSDK